MSVKVFALDPLRFSPEDLETMGDRFVYRLELHVVSREPEARSSDRGFGALVAWRSPVPRWEVMAGEDGGVEVLVAWIEDLATLKSTALAWLPNAENDAVARASVLEAWHDATRGRYGLAVDRVLTEEKASYLRWEKTFRARCPIPPRSARVDLDMREDADEEDS